MKLIALDTETHLIQPGVPTPKLVCLSYSTSESSGLLGRDKGIEQFKKWAEEGYTFIFHNGVFDLSVLTNEDKSLLPVIFQLVEDFRVRDTLHREMLFHIRRGTYSEYRGKLSLAHLSRKYLGEELVKGEDSWRYRYAELDGVPIKKWPKEAVDYPVKDAEATWDIYHSQEDSPDEWLQIRADWALRLISVHGIITDPVAVDKLEKELVEAISNMKDELVASGVVRVDKKGKLVKDTKLIRETVERYLGDKAERTNPSKKFPIGQVKIDSKALSKTGDSSLMNLVEYSETEKLLTTYVPLLKGGTTVPINAKFNVLVETGRTSCSNPNLQNQPRKPGVRECYVPREGHAFIACDYDTLELRAVAQICYEEFGHSDMRDALIEGKDLHLDLAASILHISYEEAKKLKDEGDKRIKDARQFAKCFHPTTEILTRRGWIFVADLQMEDEVACPFHDGSIRWMRPLRLTERSAETLVHIENEGVDALVTPDHNMLTFDKNFVPSIQKADSVSCRYVLNAGQLAQEGYGRWDEINLRLAVAIQADGSYCKKTDAIKFGFTKRRKIERFRELFCTKFSEIRESKTNQGVTTFYIPASLGNKLRRLLTEDKQFPLTWLGMSQNTANIVLDEISFWDSHVNSFGLIRYSSMHKQNVDVLQALCVLNGRKASITKEVNRFGLYVLSIKKRGHTRGDFRITEVPYSGKVYCLTTPTGCVMTRRNGKTLITMQCGNFGYLGGLGVNSFVKYAEGVGYTTNVEEAKALRDTWFNKWSEMREYFNKASGISGETGSKRVKIPFSGRIRGKVSFTQAANTPFQGTAADGAKLAGFAIQKECWVDEDSPLYGCRPVAFIHDEYIVEAPLEKVDAAARRLEKVMNEQMSIVIPDVPITSSAHAMVRWYKEAEAVYDTEGKLVPWKPLDS